MADSLLDNYNPLYDIHLRQYFALPHMQKHLQKMGLLESTLNLNGDEVYARHHAMMDMMLKNREAQLMKMAELRKKLDAAEKVECCRRIRTGQSPESYRQGKPSRSLSRNRAVQQNGNNGRQRRYSNSFEDRDFVQRIEERNAEPVEHNTRDPYKRLSANAKRFNYLHKLDDNTLIAYKDNLKKQLQRLERFREISFGPHSVARQPPPQQASWFFRRRSLPSLTASAPGSTLKEPLRSVLNMRGRKPTIGNKQNAIHDNRTSCPPTTRKRKDSIGRLPPIHPQKNRVSTKPPAPVSLQQITTKLPPASKKPAPNRGRPSNKRQTTTTTTTTITSVSKSPQLSETNTLPLVTGHGIFTGAAAAATASAIGTAAINIDNLIEKEAEVSPSETGVQPAFETQKTFDRSSPIEDMNVEALSEVLNGLADNSEKVAEQEEQEFIPRQIILDNTPVDHTHGDYEDSDSEPEYAEDDDEPSQEAGEEEFAETVAAPIEPLAISVNEEQEHASLPDPIVSQDSLKDSAEEQNLPAFQNAGEQERVSRSPPTFIVTEQSTEEPASPDFDVHSTHVVEHFESHDATPQSPVLSIHEGRDDVEEAREHEALQSPMISIHASEEDAEYASEGGAVPNILEKVEHEEYVIHKQETQSTPPASEHSEYIEHHVPAQDGIDSSEHASQPEEEGDRPPPEEILQRSVDIPESAMQTSYTTEREIEISPSVYSSQTSEQLQQTSDLSDRETRSPTLESSVTMQESFVAENRQPLAQSPVLSDRHESAPQSPVLSLQGSHVSDKFDQHEPAPQSPLNSERAASTNYSHASKDDDPAPQSPVISEKALSIHSSHASEYHEQDPHSPVVSERAASTHDAHVLKDDEPAPQSPVTSERALSIHSSHASEYHEQDPHSPVESERAASTHYSHASKDDEPAPQSPVISERALSIYSSHASEHHEQDPHSPVESEKAASIHAQNDEKPESQSVTVTEISYHSSDASEHREQAPESPVESPVDNINALEKEVRTQHDDEALQSPVTSEKEFVFERAPSVHSQASDNLEQVVVAADGLEQNESPPVVLPREELDDRAASANSIQQATGGFDHDEVAAPLSPDDALKSPALSVNVSQIFENSGHVEPDHHDHHLDEPLRSSASPLNSQSVPEEEPKSPAASEDYSEHIAPENRQQDAPSAQPSENQDSTDISKNSALLATSPEDLSHEAPPVVTSQIISPSSHESDAEEEAFAVQHHSSLTLEKSSSELDLYNPSRDNQESPVPSEPRHFSPKFDALPVADQMDLDAYHNSPTKESTSPVAVNPVIKQFSAEEIIENLTLPAQGESAESTKEYENIIQVSADEEASNVIPEALTETPALEKTEHFEDPENYELKYNDDDDDQYHHKNTVDAMTTSIYQPSSEDHEAREPEPLDETDNWNNEDRHVKESTDEITRISLQDTDNGNDNNGQIDNISTDSLIIHDNHPHIVNMMTQSIYQPLDSEEAKISEQEWDDGNKHVHEIVTGGEYTDETGRKEIVTTTTTVIKSGDDLENNNDETDIEERIDEKAKNIEEKDGHGSNGNLARETIITTTYTVASGGLPEGGILVDDGDETNISSL